MGRAKQQMSIVSAGVGRTKDWPLISSHLNCCKSHWICTQILSEDVSNGWMTAVRLSAASQEIYYRRVALMADDFLTMKTSLNY